MVEPFLWHYFLNTNDRVKINHIIDLQYRYKKERSADPKVAHT